MDIFAIEKSILTQKQIFYAYQPHLLRFLNTDEGKDFLWKRLGTKFSQPITEVGRNYIFEYLQGKEYRGTFYSRQPFTDLLLPLIQKGERLRVKYDPYTKMHEAFAFYAGLKKGKLPRIYEEELRGQNPLGYAILEKYPQLKWLNSPATFNPAAGANSPVDGRTVRNGVDESFASIIDGAGAAASVSDTGLMTLIIASGTTNQFTANWRSITCFDTSALGATVIISAAILSIYGSTHPTGLGETALHIAGATPANTNNLVSSDYNQFARTTFGNIAGASWSNSAYNDIVFNATGLAAISKTAVSPFANEISWDINSSFGGSWSSGQEGGFTYLAADNGSNIPKLVVTFTQASASASESKSLSPSASESKSQSPSASESKSASPSASASASESKSASPSASASASASESKSQSPSASESASASASESKSLSPSASESKSTSASSSASESRSTSPSISSSASESKSSSASESKSASASASRSESKSSSASASASPSPASYTAKYTEVVGNTYTAKYTEWADLPD